MVMRTVTSWILLQASINLMVDIHAHTAIPTTIMVTLIKIRALAIHMLTISMGIPTTTLQAIITQSMKVRSL